MEEEKTETKRLEFRFGAVGKYIPLMVAVVFIVIAGTHQSNVNGYCLAFFIAVIVGAPFAKNFTAYGEAAIGGLGRSIFAVIAVAVILAAISGKLVSESGLVSALAYLVLRSGMGGGVFAAMSFLICCLLSMSTGSSVGTYSVAIPLLFPVGVLSGVAPAVMIGALVSGALFGDNLAPISDTTIASANTQGASMGGVVRSRIWYSLPASAVTAVLLLLIGGRGGTAAAATELEFQWKSLLMIVVPAVIILCCLLKMQLIVSLSMGILTGILMGVLSGLYSISDIFSYPGGWSVGGLFIDAVTGTVGTVFMLIGAFMLLGIMQASGVIEDISRVLMKIARGRRSTEAAAVISVGVMGWLTGVVAVAMVTVGDVVRTLGEKFGVNPYRRANLMDCGGLCLTALAPWTVHAILPASLANGSVDISLTPLSVVTHNYYAITLLIIMVLAIITGYGFKTNPGTTAPGSGQEQEE